jgi:hypothetical protein
MLRFWIGPFLILVCSYAIADYQRQILAFISQSALIVLAHGFFFVITRPTKGNKSFPYHVKTSKVSLIIVKEKDQSVLENFPHHKQDQGNLFSFYCLLMVLSQKIYYLKKGGNMEFASTSSGIDFHDLFVVKNHGDKYKQNNFVRFIIL